MKSFKEFLAEMPYLITKNSKSNFDHHTKNLQKEIKLNYKHSSKLSPTHRMYKTDDGTHVYFHLKNKKIHSISQINSNHQQVFATKCKDGSGDLIHKNMRHHIETYGELHSDSTHTPGSKNLWLNFIKKNPDLIFTHSDNHTRPKVIKDIDKENLWDSSRDKMFNDHKISAHKK